MCSESIEARHRPCHQYANLAEMPDLVFLQWTPPTAHMTINTSTLQTCAGSDCRDLGSSTSEPYLSVSPSSALWHLVSVSRYSTSIGCPAGNNCSANATASSSCGRAAPGSPLSTWAAPERQSARARAGEPLGNKRRNIATASAKSSCAVLASPSACSVRARLHKLIATSE